MHSPPVAKKPCRTWVWQHEYQVISECLCVQYVDVLSLFPAQSQCEPQSYRPMHHEDFKEDLRSFRLKSRTWAGERSKRDMYSRLKNL